MALSVIVILAASSRIVGGATSPLSATATPSQETTRVSIDSTGVQGDSQSDAPSISTDGRFVAFYSHAANLVTGDTNNAADIFVHDRLDRETTRVSVSSAGEQANDYSYTPVISANGRFVAFHSLASNLVPDDTNNVFDVFVHDRQTGETTRVSVDSAGAQADFGSVFPVISVDGRFVAFASYASNLVAGDTNHAADVFVHDRQTGETTRVSVDSAGAQGDNYSYLPSISADGRFVAFYSAASNLVAGDTNHTVDVFVHDRLTGETTRVSIDSDGVQANSDSYLPSISADGRFVAFTSHASNLVAGDINYAPDIFVHDRLTGETTRVSVDSAGAQANASSEFPKISADGRFVAFYSSASNLVAGDTNDAVDIFVHDRLTGETTRVSVDSNGAQANSYSFFPASTMMAPSWCSHRTPPILWRVILTTKLMSSSTTAWWLIKSPCIPVTRPGGPINLVPPRWLKLPVRIPGPDQVPWNSRKTQVVAQ